MTEQCSITRRVAYMSLEEGPEGIRLPTLWDEDDETNSRVRVGAEIYCCPDGQPADFVVSSDPNHIMMCEQNPGPEYVDCE